MIAFERFRKTYGGHVAVEDLTLGLSRGEVVAMIGPNGSGKTTTLKAAAGLIHPTSGRVRLGVPGSDASDPEARELLSFLPQRVAFPEALTGREVVEFYRSLRHVAGERTREVLHFASLNGSSDRLIGTYSGGMIQRLGLAVAALPDAPILLLDEPTAALDPAGLEAFYDLVDRRAREGRTVLFTSHQLGDAERLADRFAVLVEGRLMAVFTQRELHERLAKRGVMFVWLSAPGEALLPALRLLAPGATLRGDELTVPGPPELRPAVLEAISRSGIAVAGLTTQEGRLDELYRELVGDSK